MSKVDNNLIAPMDDEIDSLWKSLKPLFPNLNDEELKAVEDTFYGYLEIAWRIFERIETKEEQRAQEKRGKPRVRMPSRVSAFLSNFVKAKNKKRRGW